ncbi:MAG TPA: response regulator [Thermoanaerobaculia bacterium]
MIEDDHAYSEEVAAAMRSRGLGVTVAATAGEAVALLDKERYELLVLDLVLNGSDGFAVLERLRNKSTNVPVIVVTNFARDYVRELTTYFTQVRVIINKPCSPQQLLANVTTTIES